MSPTLVVTAAIVMASSAGFVIVGSIYRWDLRSEGYARWTRIVGVAAVLGLAGVSAWSDRAEPLVAAAILAGGAALAAVYVAFHRRLIAKIRESLGPRGSA